MLGFSVSCIAGGIFTPLSHRGSPLFHKQKSRGEKLPSVKLGPGVMLEHFPKHLIIDPFVAEYPISIPLSSCSVKCCPEEKQAFKCYYSLKYSECLLWANHQAKQKACNW